MNHFIIIIILLLLIFNSNKKNKHVIKKCNLMIKSVKINFYINN